MNQRKNAFPWLGANAVAAMALVAGCATGPEFVAPEAPQAGEAAIYLYRKGAIGGSAITHAVTVNGSPAGKLLNGSYLRVALPAPHDFVDLLLVGCARLRQPLSLRVGQTAYVQAMLINKTFESGGRAYFDYGCQLAQQSEADAFNSLAGLRRAN
jgi:hypothetical protein